MKSLTARHPVWPSLLLVLMVNSGVCADPDEDSAKSNSFLERHESEASSLRILSWNVWRGSILSPDGIRHESFKRILKAVRPDVICLQEVGGPKVETELRSLVVTSLPLEDDQKWHLHYAPNSDNVVMSRYPLQHCSHEHVIHLPVVSPDFHLGFIGCMIEVPEAGSLQDVYLVAAHFLSAGQSGMGARQRHADAIVRHLRTLRQSEKASVLPTATPTVILGDFNVYALEPKDAAHHLTTLLTGNVVNEAEFGPDFDLDWDGSFMVEVKPRHNADSKEWYTWRSDQEPFAPGCSTESFTQTALWRLTTVSC